MKKLTPAQLGVLRKMSEGADLRLAKYWPYHVTLFGGTGGGYSNVRRATFDILCDAGAIEADDRARLSHHYTLTPAGRAALADAEKGRK